MLRTIAAGTTAALLFAVTAHAQQANCTWTGYGTDVNESTKCSIYKMKIDVTVNGTTVKGVYQQEGRAQRTFEATLGNGGVFSTLSTVSGGDKMKVSGVIANGAGKILLDGYCKFESNPSRAKA